MPKLSHQVRIVFLFIASLFAAGIFPAFAHYINQDNIRTVRVAYFYGEGFQDKSSIDGSRFGYGYEYLQKIAYFAGWKYEYIDTNWAEAVEMIKDGRADILAEVSKTPEREKFMLFADRGMGEEEYYIFIHPDSSTIDTNDLDSLNGTRIGVNAGSYQLQVFREWCAENKIRPNIIEYEDEDERNKDFLTGKLDAAVDYDFYLDQGWLPLLKIGKSDYYIAVTPSKPEILEELNYAQGKLFESAPLIIDHLQTIYFPHEVVSKRLTPGELDWLNHHLEISGKITIGYISDALPYCKLNKTTGEVVGVLPVFVNKLQEVFGIDVELRAFDNGNDLYEALQKNEICSAYPAYSELWQAEQMGIMLSEPFLDLPQAIVFRKNKYESADDMKNFAVSKLSSLQEFYIHDRYPGKEIVYFDSYDECLKGVSQGKADGLFVNTYVLTRKYSEFKQYENLDVSYLPNDARLGIAVAFGSSELLSIFNKVIVMLDKGVLSSSLTSNSQVQNVYSLKTFFREYAIAIIVFVFVFSVLIIVVMRHQIVRMRAAKKIAEDAHQKASLANMELENALRREKESQAAVQEAFVAANKANAAKTEFLASMSHDIRTPMNAIIGMTAIAAANLGDKEKMQHCLTEITTSSKHLLSLINEVLDMNKIESGKVTLNESPFNLANLIEDFVSVSKSLVKEKNHEFNVNVHDIRHENVIGDESRIQQCMMNFMSNAVKYTPEGGKINFCISEKITNRPKIACYEFIFEDNGVGISEDFIPKMFDPFTRADDERIQKQQGTGLGMPITRNIIRMMSGDIKVESKLNEGTKITTTMYLQLQDIDEDIDVTSLADLPVLVADDDKAACETTCFILNELGMASEGVLSGKEAVAKVIERHENKKDYFAAIIDWKMPEMDGVETTRQIRAAVGNDVPILIISAYDWTDIESEAREAGATAFIAKPVFKSKMAHTFLELTGKETAKTEDSDQATLNKYRQENFKNARVLLTEDNKVNAEIAKEILGMTGLEVDLAWNGQEALEKLSTSSDGYYKMVFMDLQMPIMNGYEAVEKIRASERNYLKTIPIVAMSANAFAEDIEKSKSVGMNEHISKPLDFEKLLKVLEKYL